MVTTSAPVTANSVESASSTEQSGKTIKIQFDSIDSDNTYNGKTWQILEYETFPFKTVLEKGDSLTFSNPPLFVCPVGETVQNIYGVRLPPAGAKLDDNSVWQVLDSDLKRKDMAKMWPHNFILKGQIRLNRPHRGLGALKSNQHGWQFVDGISIGAQGYPPYLLCGDPVFMNWWSPV